MRERFRLAYGPVMHVEIRASGRLSEADADRVVRALAVGFLIHLVVLPLMKWIILLLVLPALLLFLL